MARRVLSGARDGAVVLMHDGGGNRAGTVAALRPAYPALKQRGFEFVTMSELAGLAEAPPTEAGMVLTIGDQAFRVEGGLDDVKVRVDGAEIPLGTPPMRAEGQFLVQGRPVLEALGASCEWDQETLSMAISAPRGRFVVKLDGLSDDPG